MVPIVTVRTPLGDRSMDLFSSLLSQNIVFISGVIDDETANLVSAQLLFLEGEDPDKDISLYINSPGGSVTSALAIYDTMQFVNADVSTTCIGEAGNVSAVLIAAGTKGKRFALPNARLLIAQPSLEEVGGQATDVAIQAKEIVRLRSHLSAILSRHTEQTMERIERDIERDLILNPTQALEYGLIDCILQPRINTEESPAKPATGRSHRRHV
ncbi:MAG TPA: ATP-dependent Clp protease proteolytic subunit [Blastocatellia bacterium]|nr:ATP-dependent Clp protease proteolytic subunit [Blastocatellia bacterium]